jgi:hypothetical protein
MFVWELSSAFEEICVLYLEGSAPPPLHLNVVFYFTMCLQPGPMAESDKVSDPRP